VAVPTLAELLDRPQLIDRLPRSLVATLYRDVARLEALMRAYLLGCGNAS
jgi:hypothetical protein